MTMLRPVRTSGMRGAISIAAAALLAVVLAPAIQAQAFTVLYTFSGRLDGGNPEAGLTRDKKGNLYGTTYWDGFSPKCCGTAFALDAGGALTSVHQFRSPGAHPAATMVRDAAGNLYGTTVRGGHRQSGIIFQWDPTGKLTELYSFLGGQDGNKDGAFPRGNLVRDSSGNLLGTTSQGGEMTGCSGNFGCGTIFKLDTFTHETVLHIFTGGSDGGIPLGGLMQDGAGNLYGTASVGGSGAGTVFKVDSNGVFSVLYTFTGEADGGSPEAGLIIDAAGNLYGTTAKGGAHGVGTVFKLNTSGSESVLHSFKNFPKDGAEPVAALVQDAAGNLYGTTKKGGAFRGGAVFKLTSTGKEYILYSFTGGADGRVPVSELVRDGAGNLYGTAENGGVDTCGELGCGVIFKITP